MQQPLDRQRERADQRRDKHLQVRDSSFNASAGNGRRKRRVTQCYHCQCQGRQTSADFVHLFWYPATDLGPIGFCWPCYEKAAKDLLDMYSDIVALASEIDALYAALPDDQRQDVRPLHPPTYS